MQFQIDIAKRLMTAGVAKIDVLKLNPFFDAFKTRATQAIVLRFEVEEEEDGAAADV